MDTDMDSNHIDQHRPLSKKEGVKLRKIIERREFVRTGRVILGISTLLLIIGMGGLFGGYGVCIILGVVGLVIWATGRLLLAMDELSDKIQDIYE